MKGGKWVRKTERSRGWESCQYWKISAHTVLPYHYFSLSGPVRLQTSAKTWTGHWTCARQCVQTLDFSINFLKIFCLHFFMQHFLLFFWKHETHRRGLTSASFKLKQRVGIMGELLTHHTESSASRLSIKTALPLPPPDTHMHPLLFLSIKMHLEESE